MKTNYMSSPYAAGSAVMEPPVTDYSGGASAAIQAWKSGGREETSPEEELTPVHRVRTVSVCDTQPVTSAGIRTLLEGNPDIAFADSTDSLERALDLVRRQAPDVILLDKAFGIQAILDWLGEVRLAESRTGIIVWGVSITEAEALRFLQSGARGILRKTAAVNVVLACLRTVSEGRSWMEDSVFRDAGRPERYPRSELTAREQQVLELVEQGCKNKEIAQELGIRPGTVKIHLKHIFEKTGVRGRYGLALSGLKERGLVSVPAPI
jgi:two-component system, NarL family, nitrate/nitrite response regulator NarL